MAKCCGRSASRNWKGDTKVPPAYQGLALSLALQRKQSTFKVTPPLCVVHGGLQCRQGYLALLYLRVKLFQGVLSQLFPILPCPFEFIECFLQEAQPVCEQGLEQTKRTGVTFIVGGERFWQGPAWKIGVAYEAVEIFHKRASAINGESTWIVLFVPMIDDFQNGTGSRRNWGCRGGNFSGWGPGAFCLLSLTRFSAP